MLYSKQGGCKPSDFNRNFDKNNNKMSGQILTLVWPFLRFAGKQTRSGSTISTWDNISFF